MTTLESTGNGQLAFRTDEQLSKLARLAEKSIRQSLRDAAQGVSYGSPHYVLQSLRQGLHCTRRFALIADFQMLMTASGLDPKDDHLPANVGAAPGG